MQNVNLNNKFFVCGQRYRLNWSKAITQTTSASASASADNWRILSFSQSMEHFMATCTNFNKTDDIQFNCWCFIRHCFVRFGSQIWNLNFSKKKKKESVRMKKEVEKEGNKEHLKYLSKYKTIHNAYCAYYMHYQTMNWTEQLVDTPIQIAVPGMGESSPRK